jgi:MoxR-like ATPase
MRTVTGSRGAALSPVLNKDEIIALQDLVRRVPVADHIFAYVSALVRATRPGETEALDFVNNWVSWGCGPRACLNLISGAKARAILRGRYNVAMEDVRALALPVLRHRMGLNFAAQSEGVDTDHVVKNLLEAIPEDGPLYDGNTAPAQTA